jgi:hypothetical protein
VVPLIKLACRDLKQGATYGMMELSWRENDYSGVFYLDSLVGHLRRIIAPNQKANKIFFYFNA